MDARLVAADASPLIGLAAAGAFDLLHRLFATVTVTAVVRDEVLAGGDLPGAAELAEAMRAGWIKVVDTESDTALFGDLDEGEASTLTLASQQAEPCLVLMDEALGRWHANEHGFTVTGLAGVLIAARRAGIVDSVRPYVDRLARSDFRISDSVVRAVLQAGETSTL